jgi:uncharacterized membrane protein YhdT
MLHSIATHYNARSGRPVGIDILTDPLFRRRGNAMMTSILFGWIMFSAAVGILAGRYHRDHFGWMVLACVISPLIAFVLLLAVGKAEADDGPIRITREVESLNQRKTKRTNFVIGYLSCLALVLCFAVVGFVYHLIPQTAVDTAIEIFSRYGSFVSTFALTIMVMSPLVAVLSLMGKSAVSDADYWNGR